MKASKEIIRFSRMENVSNFDFFAFHSSFVHPEYRRRIQPNRKILVFAKD